MSEPRHGTDEVGDAPQTGNAPANLNLDAARTGQIVRAVQQAVRQAVRPVEDNLQRVEGHAQTSFKWLLAAFGAGFVLIGSMVIGSYRWGHEDLKQEIERLEKRIDKLDERAISLGTSQAVTNQKLQDLLDRVPPIIAPVPGRTQ